MGSLHQIEANRENSLKSTGPSTPEGKKRSSMNAVRHGFTGQILILTEAEAPIYDEHCRAYRDQFFPKGKLENDLVQQLADQFWSLNRLRAQANNLTAIDLGDTGDDLASAQAAAQAIRDNIKALGLLSIYEQRKERAIEKTLRLLNEIRNKRFEFEAAELKEAARYHEVFESKEEGWIPADDGFVCSSVEVDAYLRKQARAKIVSREAN
jgi:hypothetical protein